MTRERVRIDLLPAPRSRVYGLILAGLAAIYFPFAIYTLIENWRAIDLGSMGVRAVLLAGVALGAVLSLGATKYLGLARSGQAIELHSDYVVLPTDTPGSFAVAYDSLTTSHVLGWPPRRVLVLGGAGRTFVFRESRFADGDTFNHLVRELRAHVRDLPEGQSILRTFDHNLRFTRFALAKSTGVTSGLLFLILAVYGAEYLTGALDFPHDQIRLGANSPRLVADGQTFRLITSAFLHFNWVHLYFNGIALLSLGSLVERLIGSPRYLLVYLASAFAGSLASVWFAQAAQALGASGAVFGLLGSFFTINMVYRGRLPAEFQKSARWWALILGINAALPLALPVIDVGAHAGGFVAGALITSIWTIGRTPVRLLVAPAGRHTVVVAIAAGLMSSLAGIVGLDHAIRGGPEDAIRVIETMPMPPGTAGQLNDMAWQWATEKKMTRERLQILNAIAERVAREEPGEDTIQDTVATIRYLLGDFGRAVELERGVLAKHPRAFYASQLARFEVDRLKYGSGTRQPGLQLLLDEAPGGGRAVVAAGATAGFVEAVATRGDEIVGYLRVQPGNAPIEHPSCPCNDWPLDTTLTPVFTSTAAVLDPIRAWDYDRDAAKLPRFEPDRP